MTAMTTQVGTETSSAGKLLLDVKGLTKIYPGRGAAADFHALKGNSFSLTRGEALGIVGESGSGKTTTAKIVAGIIEATDGEMRFAGHKLSFNRSQEDRRLIRYIYQEPIASLDPQMTIRRILEEPLKLYGLYSRDKAEEQLTALLASVELGSEVLQRHPRELSGGQCQRIGIARALVGNPQILICDEPTSALDATTQRQVLDLLVSLKRERGLSYLFITHNLAVAKFMTERVIVMQGGSIVETGATKEVFAHPLAAYTRELLSCVPKVDIPYFPVS